MNKEQKDLAWACLPKEVRKEIRAEYLNAIEGSDLESFLQDFFGHHNLTSDTEPEEMLMVSRSEVQEAYKAVVSDMRRSVLFELFGEKCQPNKEETKQKFDIGQKVKIILCTHPEYRNKVGIITLIDSCGNLYVKVEGLGTLFHAPYALEPYTEESETKDNSIQEQQEFQEQIFCNPDRPTDEEIYRDLTGEIPLQEENDMEENELKLCELLKGCSKGEKFYSRCFGTLKFERIREDELLIFRDTTGVTMLYHPSGKYYKDGEVDVYPSKELYEKYPLDAYSAWMEWKEARKPKRWRAKNGEGYWRLNVMGEAVIAVEHNTDVDNDGYNFGNYFSTEEEAQQAADVIRKTLAKLYEQNSQK